MIRILTFKEFSLIESSSAGNRTQNYTIPFKYSLKDPRYNYNSTSFVEDLEAFLLEKPHLKKEILKFLMKKEKINKISDLKNKPFAFVYKLIPEIEKIIDENNYEPDIIMPGGGLLFIKNKFFKDGSSADFYINKKGTKIEVVKTNIDGTEESKIYPIKLFSTDDYEFTEEEKEKLKTILKTKGIVNY